MSGWIKLHRKIQEHWIWQEKPFDKKSAWIDLILMANHKDNKFLLGNELVEVERGSFITSELKLSERWGWSRSKVRGFLKLLESDKMLIRKTDKKKTTLTIVNYSDYQISETAEEHQKNIEKTSKKHQKNTNKNDKNDKNIYSAFFEEVWKMYPNKKGKGQVSDTKKKEIHKLGDEFKRCIERYVKDVEDRRNSGFQELKFQNGSTFFNSGYVDYLDKNYEDKPNNKSDDPYAGLEIY